MPELLSTKPTKGCVVFCRSHNHLVEDVKEAAAAGDTVVRLACLDDDANGQITEVFWEREVDARSWARAPGRRSASGASMTRRCSPATCIPCSGTA